MGFTDNDLLAADVVVRPQEDVPAAEWDRYVLSHGSSSPCHLSAWKRTIERAFGFKARCLVAEQAGAVSGVLPLFLVSNRIMGSALISSPFAVYGGICASNDEARDALLGAAREMAAKEKVEYLELRERQQAAYDGFLTKELYVAFDQDLPRDEDTLLKGLPRDTRYMIRKAQKNGLRAVFDNNQADVFYDIYARSVRHLGTPVFSRRYFAILLEEFQDMAEIAVIWHGDRALAAVLSFYFQDWVLPYYGGSLLEGRSVAANNFMYWEVMKRAMGKGIRHFDFGRSKTGTGAFAFKTQWNMRQHALPYQFFLVNRKTMPNYSPANPRFELATALWRRMPFSLTKVLGPALVRLFP